MVVGDRTLAGIQPMNSPSLSQIFFFFWVVPKWFSLLRTLSLSLSTSKFQRLVFSLTMKNIKRCFKVVKQYNLSNNPSSSLMTQIASQKKKNQNKTKYETEIHESKGTKPRYWKFLITIQLEFDTKPRYWKFLITIQLEFDTKPKNRKFLITIQFEFDLLGCFPDFNEIPKLTANIIEDNRVRD